MTDPSAKGVLLVVGLCSQRGRSSEPYRGYMLEIATAEAPVWLFDVPGQTWQDTSIVGKTEFDVFDVEETVAQALRLAETHTILGVWGPDEATTPSAAAAAAALGLPGAGLAAVQRARDKASSRETLTGAGLVQPRSVPVASLAEAEALAADWGYPLVLKPRMLGASLGVVKAETADDLAQAYASARNAVYAGLPTLEHGVLVEEYLDGEEISIDGSFDGTDFLPLGIARKTLGYAPYFEEVQHVVQRDHGFDAAVIEAVAAAHRALGLGSLVSHTEVRLTRRGPAVVEVNVRPGGDFIPLLIERATGVSPQRVAVQLALGTSPQTDPTHDTTAAIRFVYVPRDGVFEEILGVDDLPTGTEYLELVQPGTALRLPPRGYLGRVGAVIAVGAPDIIEQQLDEAFARLSVRVSDIEEPTPPAVAPAGSGRTSPTA